VNTKAATGSFHPLTREISRIDLPQLQQQEAATVSLSHSPFLSKANEECYSIIVRTSLRLGSFNSFLGLLIGRLNWERNAGLKIEIGRSAILNGLQR